MNKLDKLATILFFIFAAVCIVYFTIINVGLAKMDDGAEQAKEFPPLVIVEKPVEYVETAPEKVNLGVFKLTAYCPCERCCGVWAKNRPVDACGNPVVIGSAGDVLCQGVSVAVDPSVIPYGTELEIGGRKYVAQDCGGAIKGNRIDVYFDNHADALEFGVQVADVYRLDGAA